MLNFESSIFLASYKNYDEFMSDQEQLLKMVNYFDDKLLSSRHPSAITGYCNICKSISKFDYQYHGLSNGSAHPAWTETFNCNNCEFNSRSRAIYSFLEKKIKNNNNLYIAEQITSFYKKLVDDFDNVKIVGSEYVSSSCEPGSMHEIKFNCVRHEDLTNLSFSSDTFDIVVTRDVFEHIPLYNLAFCEICRILKPTGSLIFSIPFHFYAQETVIRATINSDGSLTHQLPIVIHGNPISGEGSLCYQDFGWSIIDDLLRSGFTDAFANLYYSPLHAHLGSSFFIFEAKK